MASKSSDAIEMSTLSPEEGEYMGVDDDEDDEEQLDDEDFNGESDGDLDFLLQDGLEPKELSLFRRIEMEVREQLGTALPTLQSMVLTKIPWLISLRFVGGIGAEELAAAALATTLCNVTGLSLSVGLSSALTTLAGNAKGELHSKRMFQQKNKSVSFELRKSEGNEQVEEVSSSRSQEQPLSPLVFLYRGLFLQLSFVLPIGIWWIFGIKQVLLNLGQPENISAMTEEYLRVLAPGLWGYSISWTLTAWVQAIGLPDVPAKAALLGLVLHLPFNWFFIDFIGWGYLGCAYATVCFQVMQPLFLLSYLFVFARGRERVLESMSASAIGRTELSFWREFNIAVSIKGIMQYMALALPGIVIISEWWASEISIFLAGRLEPSPESALGGMLPVIFQYSSWRSVNLPHAFRLFVHALGMTIYQSINTFCFMFPIAFGVAGSTRVGNLLGAGNPKGADLAAKISVASAATVSAALGCLLFLIPHTFLPSLFAPDEEEVILEASRTIPLLGEYFTASRNNNVIGSSQALSPLIQPISRSHLYNPSHIRC
jgi:MATE family multidrug resistance protein